MIRIHVLLFLLIYSALYCASQFRIVDSSTNQPVSGAYVFDSENRLLEVTKDDGIVSAHNGLVFVRLLSYESATVDASTQKDDVNLFEKPYALSELTVNNGDYIKYSGVFRDVFRTEDKLTLYREGLVDFYLETKKGKFTRRVRACRQYCDKRLFKLFDFSLFAGPYSSFDMRRIKNADRDIVTYEYGDTTAYSSNGVADAIIYIDNKEKGIYRTIIDGLKVNEIMETVTCKHKTWLFDWTYNSPVRSLSNMLSYSSYRLIQFSHPLNLFKSKDISFHNEFVLTEVKSLSKQDDKNEMSDKHETAEFSLPDILPALNFNLADEIKDMKMVKFDEF